MYRNRTLYKPELFLPGHCDSLNVLKTLKIPRTGSTLHSERKKENICFGWLVFCFGFD